MSRSERSGWSACLVIALVLGAALVFVVGVGAIGLVLFLRSQSVAAGATREPPRDGETPSVGEEDPPADTPSSADESPDFTLKTSFTPYSVSGRTAPELRSDLNAKGPLDATGRHDAYTRWSVRWTYPRVPSPGSCGTGLVHVEVQVTYTMPEWSPPEAAPPDVVERWQRYRRALEKHEDGHKDHGVDAGHEVLRKLHAVEARSTCDELDREVNAAANGALADYRAKDVAYDNETKHGATQNAIFP